jgi:hypothetical protein
VPELGSHGSVRGARGNSRPYREKHLLALSISQLTRSGLQIEDIFDLQDGVTSSVIGAISPQLERAEIERAQRKPTENLQAYDYYLRAFACFYKFESASRSERETRRRETSTRSSSRRMSSIV